MARFSPASPWPALAATAMRPTRHLQTCAFDAGQPIVMVLLTHLWISALAAINSCQLPGRLTNPQQFNPGAIQLAHLFQKAQISIRIGPHESTAMFRQG
jgi:hypothetical protein